MSTRRTNPMAPGRLFPSTTWDHGWSLSLQADKAGYQCSPREQLDCLEDYDAVEAKIDGPFDHVVDPETLDLPASVLAKFSPIETGIPAIGQCLTWGDVDELKKAIVLASRNPNAGVPRGHIGWGGMHVYHGASIEDAEDIAAHGINIAKSHHGYFGQAFYVADDRELAISNYAEFSDADDGGAVIMFQITEGANILDLRNARDSEVWQASGMMQLLGARSDFAQQARRRGIDGVYDRSVGGLAIYNTKALSEPIWVFPADPETKKICR